MGCGPQLDEVVLVQGMTSRTGELELLPERMSLLIGVLEEPELCELPALWTRCAVAFDVRHFLGPLERDPRGIGQAHLRRRWIPNDARQDTPRTAAIPGTR